MKKVLTGLIALVVIAGVAYFAVNKFAGADPYKDFSTLMNKIAGEGNWSAKDHSFSIMSKSLTVEGVKIEKAFTFEVGELEKITGSPIEIDSIVISGGLTGDDFTRMLGLADWRGQKKTKLADSILLSGVKTGVDIVYGKALKDSMGVKANGEGEAKSDQRVDVSIDSCALEGVELADAAPNADADFSSFIEALSIKKYSQKGLKYIISGPEGASATVSVASDDGEGFSIDKSTMSPELYEFGRQELGPWTILGAAKIKRTQARDFKFEMKVKTPADGEMNINMGLAGLGGDDFSGLGKVGAFSMDGFTMKIDGVKEGASPIAVEAKLAKASAVGLDVSPLYAKFIPLFVAISQNPEDADEIVANTQMQTLADLFAMNIDLGSASIEGFEIDVNGLIGVKLAALNISGPYKAGQIPEKSRSVMKGFELVFPADPAKAESEADGSFADIYQFIRDFGMNSFVIDSETESAYNKAAGVWTANTKSARIKDLVELSGVMELGGLTEARLEAFQKVSLEQLSSMDPEEVLGDFSFNHMLFKIADQGLLERIYAYVGKTQMGGSEADAVRQMAVGAAQMGIGTYGAEFMENPKEVADAIAAFLDKGGSLTFEVKPQPPISCVVANEIGDMAVFLNSLGLTLSNNDGAPLAVRFKNAAAMGEEPGFGDLDEMDEMDE